VAVQPTIQKVFVEWLAEAEHRLRLPVRITSRSRSVVESKRPIWTACRG
jgi:hypothetical protein